MTLLRRPSRRENSVRGLQHRLIRQAASLLLAYPDEQTRDRLESVDGLLDHITGPEHAQLARTAAHLRRTDRIEAEKVYVDTFDMQRRSTMYLTYWTAGDTRNRGTEIHAFLRAYLEAGAEPPVGESPDHLPVVLEFAATVDPVVGEKLLATHRVPIEMLRRALVEGASPYADTVAAVCATLPSVSDQQEQRARQLAHAGPPAEAIGLQPFTLTVPPRRHERTGPDPRGRRGEP